MTPSNAPFSGILILAPGDPQSSEGYRFQGLDRRTIDSLLKLGALLHRHDAHAAMADPAGAPTLTVSASGGTIPAGTTIHLGFTLEDGQGGETALSATAVATIPDAYSDPTGAPTAVLDTSAGSLLAGTPMYAITVTDGAGGETALGPPVTVDVVPSPSGKAQAQLSGLTALVDEASGSDPSAGWRMWRSNDDGNDWDFMAAGAGSTDTWTDDGSIAGDCSQSPPDVGTTGDRGSFTFEIPSAGQPSEATLINAYACTDGQWLTPCLLGSYTPPTDYDSPITFTSLPLQAGQPPAVSLCIGGANQINPDTDIIGWPWKRPVATAADLPTVGNNDGDMRETLDTHTLYVWDEADSTWNPGGGAVGPEGPPGADGAPGSDATVDVSDGTTTEAGVTDLVFAGAGGASVVVSSTGSGEATVTVTAGSGGGGAGGGPTAARAYLAAAPPAISGWTKVPVDTLSFDTASNMDVANGRFVVPADGEYEVTANASLGGAGFVGIYKNGVVCAQAGTGAGNQGFVSDTIEAVAGDHIELWVNGPSVTNNGLTQLNYLAVAAVAKAAKTTKVALAANDPIPAAATTAITWPAPATDPLGAWASAHPTRLTAPTAGVYRLDATVIFAAAAGTARIVCFAVNGAIGESASDQRAPNASGNRAEISIGDTLELAAGDYVEVQVYQDSGGALNVEPANFGQSHFSLTAL